MFDRVSFFMLGFCFAICQLNLLFFSGVVGYDFDELVAVLCLAIVFGYVGFSWGFVFFGDKDGGDVEKSKWVVRDLL